MPRVPIHQIGFILLRPRAGRRDRRRLGRLHEMLGDPLGPSTERLNALFEVQDLSEGANSHLSRREQTALVVLWSSKKVFVVTWIVHVDPSVSELPQLMQFRSQPLIEG